MEKIKLSLNDFELICQELKKEVVGARINNITVINSRDFVMSLSMIKDKKLFVSLNHQTPFISLCKINDIPSTTIGSINDSLRKIIKDSYIFDVCKLENDRIIKFTLQKANELYEKVQYDIYFECIPQRPNLIVTDFNNKIIYALHYSPLSSSRAVLNNLIYTKPTSGLVNKSNESLSIEQIHDIVKQYYLLSIEQRRKEKYEPIFKFIKIRIKSLTKKLGVLENNIKEANNKLSYLDYGNTLLALSNDLTQVKEFVKDNNLTFDDNLSIGSNANLYFKKYKKAKRTILMDEEEIKKAKKEIEYLSYIESSSQFMHDDELLAIGIELLPNKYKANKKHEPQVNSSYIYYNNIKISYGKNAKSNNELTFKIANKNDTYLHIKDYHGAHVVIHDEHPDNEVILLAAEICLILSNKIAGDIMITSMKNVKKGSALGEANLTSYSLITLNKVREETKLLLNNNKCN